MMKTFFPVFPNDLEPPAERSLSLIFILQELLLLFANKTDIYRNNLKNRDFDKEAAQIFDLEQATIAARQGASEDQKDAAKPTPSKTDSSGCFGIVGL